MKFRIPEVLFGSLLTIAIFATGMAFSSQYFPPPKSERSQNQQPDRGQRQSETEDSKGQAGQTISQPAGDPHSSKTPNNADGKSWSKIFIDHLPDWFVALFTCVLSVFTGLLWLSTNRLWKAAIDQGRLTENAMAQLEGPLIDISKIETHLSSDGLVDKLPTVRIHFKNHGRGPATISAINCRFIVAEEIPPEPQYLSGQVTVSTLILGPGQETDAPYIYELEIPPGEPGTRTELVGYLLFFGFIEYRGFFGGTHTYAFGCAPDRKHNTFEPKGGAAYNYRKYDPAESAALSEVGTKRTTTFVNTGTSSC